MQFKNWLENLEDWEVKSGGVHFKHKHPVTFPYLRNPEKAQNFGSLYQQDIEPHGRYVSQRYQDYVPKDFESGEISFKNPLVLPFNPKHGDFYNEKSWKAELHKRYGGKTGRDLALAIIADGYDGIVTLSIGPDGKPYDTREIVDLRNFK
jgi:hypothetical protein